MKGADLERRENGNGIQYNKYMPFLKLRNQKEFTRKEIKQLWDDLRLRAIWFGLVRSGKRIYSHEMKKELKEDDIIKQFAEIRAILWLLGYPLKHPTSNKKRKRKAKKTTLLLYRKAIPLMKKYIKENEGKIKRA